MYRVLALAVFSLLCTTALCAQPDTAALGRRLRVEIPARYGPVAGRIIQRAMADSMIYQQLAEMCDTYGPRLSGSDKLERALDWVLGHLKSEGFDNAHTEPVMVPHWVRGREECRLLSPRPAAVAMLGLGGSIATPPEGITADVMVVHSFDELDKRAAEARGKIVLFNVTYTSYGQTVQYRVNGAVRAARCGAVASLTRSVTPYSIYSPHTGMLSYTDSVTKIPAAAITIEDAQMIERMIARGQKVTLRLTMEANTLPDAPSRNVMAQITGSQLPQEVLVMGGHIDSWDVGQGAMDDGGGCFVAWGALRILQSLGLKPKRTVRLVMWTNEENGTAGAKAYAKAHATERHVFAIESDGGTFAPSGFGFTGNDSMLVTVRTVAGLLQPIGADTITGGGGGADIGPLMEHGMPGLSLNVDATRYFWFHHTNADTMDKLDPRQLNQCAAALAVMIYVMADM